jgi:hypothetical protein
MAYGGRLLLSLIETKWMLPLSDRFSRRMMPPACPYESRGLYSQQTIAQACASNEIEASRGVKNRDNLLNIEPILYTYVRIWSRLPAGKLLRLCILGVVSYCLEADQPQAHVRYRSRRRACPSSVQSSPVCNRVRSTSHFGILSCTT